MGREIIIDGRKIGDGCPAYIIAEISANHRQKLFVAKKLILAAKECGADAVKLQTYGPDNLTIDSSSSPFVLGDDSPWAGRTLYDLYSDAAMPMDWHRDLFDYAHDIGITIFSTAYDYETADFLERLDTPAYKIASFELTDIWFLKHVAKKKRPVIISTGMGNSYDISRAVFEMSCESTPFALLKCTSAYPSPVNEMNMSAITTLRSTFDVPIGLSDHSMSVVPPVMAIALGASIIEKHLRLDYIEDGPDATFSLSPVAFTEMVSAVRSAESAMGDGEFKVQPHECSSLHLRRSLFAVKEIGKGEMFTRDNIRSIRPSDGLHPENYYIVLGKTAKRTIARGEPIRWEDVLFRM